MMARYGLVAGLLACVVGCGGAVDDNPGEGGGAAGSSQAGSSGAAQGGAGSSFGGAGSTAGSIGVSGSIGVAGSGSTAGAGGTVDPRCPPQMPILRASEGSGADIAIPSCGGIGLTCRYLYNGCLCSLTPSGCFQVDPACPNAFDEAARSADPIIALPPVQTCTCTGTGWACGANL